MRKKTTNNELKHTTRENALRYRLPAVLLSAALVLSMAGCQNANPADGAAAVDEASKAEATLTQMPSSPAEGANSNQGDGTQNQEEKSYSVAFRTSDYAALELDETGELADTICVQEILAKQGITEKDPAYSGHLYAVMEGVMILEYYLESGDIIEAIDIESGKRDILFQTSGYLSGIDLYQGMLYICENLYDPVTEKTNIREYSFSQSEPHSVSFTKQEADCNRILESVNIASVTLNGDHSSFVTSSVTRMLDQFGFFMGYYDNNYYRYFADGRAEAIQKPEEMTYIDGYGKDVFYYTVYDMDYSSLWWSNFETGETRCITEKMSSDLIVTPEGIVYLENVSPNFGLTENYAYFYDYEKDSSNLIYVASNAPGFTDITPGAAGFRCVNNKCYYLTAENGVLEWMCATTSGETSKLNLVAKEAPFHEYGDLKSESTEYRCPFCDEIIGGFYSEILLFDEKRITNELLAQAAPNINLFIESQADEWLMNYFGVNQVVDATACEYHDGSLMNQVTETWNINQVSMLGSRYMQMEYSGYWYGGGVHGMPFLQFYLYDLQDNRVVTLQDLYQGSEEDFKDLAAKYTVIDMETNKGYYTDDPDELYQMAYDAANLLMNVSWEEDGLHLYYPIYEIGPYASMFLGGVIPYDDLGLESVLM